MYNMGTQSKKPKNKEEGVGDRVNTGTRTQTLQYHKLTFLPIEL